MMLIDAISHEIVRPKKSLCSFLGKCFFSVTAGNSVYVISFSFQVAPICFSVIEGACL